MKYQSNSPEETKKIAEDFAKRLSPGSVVTLDGDLGAGKTAFVQGMAKGLDITDYISSPTFTIVNCYEGWLPLYHFDVYRICDCDEMYEIGYEEYINSEGICVIEWSDLIHEILPPERYAVRILKDLEKGEDYREIIIEEKKV